MEAAADRLALFLVPQLVVPVAIVVILGYRLWRRRRDGGARAAALCGPAESGRNRILR